MNPQNEEERGPSPKAKWPVVGAAAAFFGGFFWLAIPFAAPAFRKVCLPYVPATERQISLVLNMRKNKKGFLVDIGSGDGRLVIEAAKQGAKAEGIELNRWLVLYSRFRAYREGVSHLTKFRHQNLWKADLSPYETIVVFGVQEMMPALEKKLENEMRDDAEVLAGRFGLANWVPTKQILDPKRSMGIHSVFVYDKQQKHKKENI